MPVTISEVRARQKNSPSIHLGLLHSVFPSARAFYSDAMRILLVEDERSAARMTAKGLREHGHAVDVVGDGAAGAHHAGMVPYDVVVLDLALPIKDGLECVATCGRKARWCRC
jgi:PleD family two-component response regulator